MSDGLELLGRRKPIFLGVLGRAGFAHKITTTQYDATLRTYRSNEHFDVSLTALGPQLGMKVHS